MHIGLDVTGETTTVVKSSTCIYLGLDDPCDLAGVKADQFKELRDLVARVAAKAQIPIRNWEHNSVLSLGVRDREVYDLADLLKGALGVMG